MTVDSKAALEARDVHVEAGGQALLDGVSARFEPGSFTALLGPNGAGKTTLLRALSGMLRMQRGEVRLFERKLSTYKRREIARSLAYLPQETTTEFDVRVWDAVALGRYAYRSTFGGPSRADVRAIESAIARVELEPFLGRTLPTLSGGERQRVFLARALAQEADVLVLDEPTSALDPRHRLELMELLSGLAAEGRTVVTALHDLGEVWRHVPRCLLLDHGRSVAVGATHEVLGADRAEEVFGVRLRVEGGELRVDRRGH